MLQKLGQVLVAVNPDPHVDEYVECNNIFNNRLHFINDYLYVNKTGGKTSPPPPIETARGLQRLSVLLMSGISFYKFLKLKHDVDFSETTKYQAAKKVLIDGTTDHVLLTLGYDIAMRNWIMEKQGALKMIVKKAANPVEIVQIAGEMRELRGEVKDSVQKLRKVDRRMEAMEEMMEKKFQAMTDLMGTISIKLENKNTLIDKESVEDEVEEDASDEE